MMPHHIGKGRIKMVYFIVFLAGMGFAALIDFTVQLIRRRRIAATVAPVSNVAVDPVKVGVDQMARLRDQMGM